MYAVQSAFSAAMTMANGGTIGQALTGAAIAMASSGVPGSDLLGNGLGGLINSVVGNELVSSMLMAGAISKAQGGKFADGVKGALIAHGIGRAVNFGKSVVANWGTTSKTLALPSVQVDTGGGDYGGVPEAQVSAPSTGGGSFNAPDAPLIIEEVVVVGRRPSPASNNYAASAALASDRVMQQRVAASGDAVTLRGRGFSQADLNQAHVVALIPVAAVGCVAAPAVCTRLVNAVGIGAVGKSGVEMYLDPNPMTVTKFVTTSSLAYLTLGTASLGPVGNRVAIWANSATATAVNSIPNE